MTANVASLLKMIDDLPSHLHERTRLLCRGKSIADGKRVVYWTHHALRTDENPALDVAILLAQKLQLPLLVYHGLSDRYRFASNRHHTFILEAARELQKKYAELGISYAFISIFHPPSHPCLPDWFELHLFWSPTTFPSSPPKSGPTVGSP